jgi:hypothetical protein
MPERPALFLRTPDISLVLPPLIHRAATNLHRKEIK